MSDYDPNYIPTKNYFLVGQKAIILNEVGRFLVLQRSEKSGGGGKWALAGGALEEKEKPFEGIKREIKEETQMEITDLKPFYVFSDKGKDGDFVVMIAYVCKARNQNVTLNWEHNDYKWVTKVEAVQMNLSEHARLLIEQFEG